MPDRATPADAVLDRLFRSEAARLTAQLARRLGAGRLDLCEEAVSQALLAAVRAWRIQGVPAEPAAWLYRVARNGAIDLLRRQGTVAGFAAAALEPEAIQPAETAGIDDDLLRLLFLCCHPSIPEPARVALTLKTVLGFDVREIAAAFLDQAATVEQRILRAKALITTEGLTLDLPSGPALDDRLESVLATIYLLFSEGYAAAAGDRLVREELCAEAIRLIRGLAGHARLATPAVQALAALMLLQAARLPARLDDAGEMVLLAMQDRRLWDRRLIGEGLFHLERAMAGEQVTAWHIEAGIAAVHAASPDAASTDWPAIRAYYDGLLALRPTGIVRLNRAVATAEVLGPAVALWEVADAAADPKLARYPYLPAVEAELLARLGRVAEAAAALDRAIALARTGPERRLLERRRLAMPPPDAVSDRPTAKGPTGA